MKKKHFQFSSYKFIKKNKKAHEKALNKLNGKVSVQAISFLNNYFYIKFHKNCDKNSFFKEEKGGVLLK